MSTRCIYALLLVIILHSRDIALRRTCYPNLSRHYTPPVPPADEATVFRRAVSLNVRIDDSDARQAPTVLEILGIVNPAPRGERE